MLKFACFICFVGVYLLERSKLAVFRPTCNFVGFTYFEKPTELVLGSF